MAMLAAYFYLERVNRWQRESHTLIPCVLGVLGVPFWKCTITFYHRGGVAPNTIGNSSLILTEYPWTFCILFLIIKNLISADNGPSNIQWAFRDVCASPSGLRNKFSCIKFISKARFFCREFGHVVNHAFFWDKNAVYDTFVSFLHLRFWISESESWWDITDHNKTTLGENLVKTRNIERGKN